MRFKTLIGSLMLSLVTVFSVAATSSQVSAHTSVQLYGSPAKADGYGHMFMRIPHGCEGGLATDTIKIQLPADFQSVKPQFKSGWKAAVSKNAAGQFEVSWSGGSLPDDQFDDFGMSVKFPKKAGDYALPTVQYCGSSSVAWIEVAHNGQDSHSLDKPAPVVKVASSDATASWTGEVSVSMSKKSSAEVVIDAPSTLRNKPVTVKVTSGSKTRTVFVGKLDSRGDIVKNVAVKSKKYHLAPGSTVTVTVAGKQIASTVLSSHSAKAGH